jgi:putative ABC transport system permease protein
VRRLSGRGRSALIIGLQGIRARKTRTLLSMVSLFLGVLAVVTVQAGAQTAEHALLSDVELNSGIDGTRSMYIPTDKEGAAPSTLEAIKGRTDAVGLTNLSATIGEPGVTPINPGGAPFDIPGGYGGPRQFICDQNGCRPDESAGAPPPPGQAIELQMVGLTGDVRQFRPFRFESGEWLNFSDAPSYSPRLVLNKEAAKGFGRYAVPAEMRLTGSTQNPTPRIIGVIDDGGSEPRAYVRVDELLNWVPAKNLVGPYGGGLNVLMSPAATDLEQILRSRLEGLGVDPQQIYVETINSRERVETALALLRVVFFGMAGLVLLIGVAGILNVGLATVGERVEEFALRRAVGTPRLLLAGIVLAETMLTGLLTAAAAIGFGAAVFQVLGSILASREPILAGLNFPWQAGLAGVIAGLIAGVLGGLVPAIRAARIPIATVMRA